MNRTRQKKAHKAFIAALVLLSFGIVSHTHAAQTPEGLYQQGVEYGREKSYDAAITALQKALKLAPKNQDYRLMLARIYSWKGDTKTAHSLVDEVLVQQPKNEEAQLLKARLHYYDQSFDLSESILSGLTSNEAAGQLLEQVRKARTAAKAAAQKRWTVAMGLEHSELSRRPQPDWKQYFIQLGYKITDNLSAYLRYEHSQRFRTHNEYVEVGADYKFTDGLFGYIVAGYSDQATFSPEIRLKAGGRGRILADHDFLGETWLTLDTQYDRFDGNVEIMTFKPGLSYTFLEDFTLSVKHINIIDDTDKYMGGWSARLDWQTPLEWLRLNAEYSEAPESENNITLRTKGLSLGAAVDFGEDMTLYMSYTHDDRQNSFVRRNASLAVVFRF